MSFDRRCGRITLIFGFLSCLVGCNDSDERKTHYVTIWLSQDVEVRGPFVDVDMKKPGVVVEHPEGVEVKHRPTKPRKSVSFDHLPVGLLALLLVLFLPIMRCERWRLELLLRPSFSS